MHEILLASEKEVVAGPRIEKKKLVFNEFYCCSLGKDSQLLKIMEE
jgi:hypothetical protein